MVASSRRHPSKAAIFAANLFMGWTFIGWVGTLVWALNSPPPERRLYVMPDGTLKLEMPPEAPPKRKFRMEDYTRQIPWYGRIGILAGIVFLLWFFGSGK
jgi:hypothetical protein